MDGLIINMDQDGSYIKITNTNLYFVDKYGNEWCISNYGIAYKQNSPSYDELYGHWIKTKNQTRGELL